MTLCNIRQTESVCGPHAARVPMFGPRWVRPTEKHLKWFRNRSKCM